MNINLVKILNMSKRKNLFTKPPKIGVINDIMKEFELNRDEAVLFSVVAKLSFEKRGQPIMMTCPHPKTMKMFLFS